MIYQQEKLLVKYEIHKSYLTNLETPLIKAQKLQTPHLIIPINQQKLQMLQQMS